ncbi:alpha/beta hydrolase [Rubellimicrobium aerolatum]|uniref:Palmitoyl-protein thioesterase ABHD10, mitochondrial n=1 Tax=Rubellimicrobium aerolatum TaxID=490979 RepID=A0ABW0S948_9RHOB|nr:alpha/beta fold hydrolase [Rubellimicrobium aerolatum]MBP1804752.1 pimeloyl-ACP methyl ester carboxylesterase [Rubellimicrobium aerolatum]
MDTIATPQGRRLAVMRQAGQGPHVVFLGGFRSDMTGTKAAWLADWAEARGRAFLRFDYSGHGQSEGAFEDGTIGQWLEDAEAVLDLAPGRAILVGSSMGGWISLLIARRAPHRVAGLVTVAAAPDFTEDSYWDGASEEQKARLMAEGVIHVPSDYGAPYPITRRLIEDGRDHLLLREPLHLPMPTRMLQGSADADVPPATAYRLLDHATGPNLRLTVVKDADHRFSSPRCLKLIAQAIGEVSD